MPGHLAVLDGFDLLLLKMGDGCATATRWNYMVFLQPVLVAVDVAVEPLVVQKPVGLAAIERGQVETDLLFEMAVRTARR